MTRYFKTLVAVVAVVALGALPGLSGCGGGGSTAVPVAQMPRELAPAPKPGSPWQAAELWQQAYGHANVGGHSPYHGLIFDTNDLDAGNQRKELGAAEEPLSVSVSPLSDGSGVRVSAVSDKDKEKEKTHFGDQSPVTFDSRGGPVFEVGTKEALLGRVAWDGGDDDDGRWTAWGWWVALRGVDFLESAPNAAPALQGTSAVFADGLEFRGPPDSLPETGIGRYRGTATGVFSAGNYTDASWHSGRGFGAARRSGAGEFTASVDLTMNYGVRRLRNDPSMTADMRVVRMDGTWWDNSGTAEEYSAGVRPQKIVQEFGASGGPAWRFEGGVSWPSSGPIHISHGTFTNYGAATSITPKGLSNVSGFVPPGENGIKVTGSLQGRLSNVSGAGGHPRSALGVFRIEGSAATGFSQDFNGVFLAPLVE